MTFSYSNEIAAAKQLAISLCQQRDFLKAKEVLDRFNDHGRMDAEALSLLGSINGQLGAFDEAVVCLQESARLEPNSPQVHFGLGMALSKLARFPEAEESFKAALQSNPDNPPAILELGIALLSQNKLSEAEAQFNQILSRDPNNLKALIGLGRVYLALNKSDIAMNYFNSAIDINPGLPVAHHHLGTIYQKKGQYEQAEAAYQKALAADPDNVQLHMELGQLYLRSNQIEQAKTEYRKSLALQPDNLDAIAGEAQLLEQSGDIQAAYERIVPYIDQGARHVDMGILFSKLCRHYSRCEESADYLEHLLDLSNDQTTSRSKLHFALGKLYDRLEDYDKAFSHFAEGNALKPDTFNQVEHVACIDTLIKTCDWNFFVNAPKSANTSQRPIFIVGMPRSGTTLTEQILCSHPEVYGAGEIITFPSIIQNLSKYLGAGSAYPENLSGLTTGILNDLSEKYLHEIGLLESESPRVTDKTLANYLYLGLISLMFPCSRIIHCRRDPRDTCLSIYTQNFDESHNYATRLENLGVYYNQYDRLMQHWKSLVKVPVYEVQYEELIDNQERISRELIDFVGLEWDERVLKFYETKRSVVTASYDQVRQKIYKKSAERWKNYQEHIGPLIEAFS